MANNTTSQTKEKNKTITLILALFFGYFGFHRFYVGKKASGWVWMFTCGLFGIGWFIDIILILTDKFTSNQDISHTNTQKESTAPIVNIKYTFVDTSAPSTVSNDRITNVSSEFISLETKKAIKEFRVSNTYIVLDLETSGLSKYKNEIIEIAMLKVENGQITDRFESLVKPSLPIDEKIERITGITNNMLSQAPSFKAIASNILSFIGDSILISHNAKFDIGFLAIALEPHKAHLKCIDTLRVARKALPELENHKLNALISHYGIANTQTHRAMDDVECTQKLFVLLCDEILSRVNKRSAIKESNDSTSTTN